MRLTRREFLAVGTALGAASVAGAQSGAQFTLRMAAVPLALTGQIGIGIYATDPCTVETRLMTPSNEPITSLKLNVSSDRRVVSETLGVVAFSGPISVQLNVYPTTAQRPYVSVVIDPSGKSSGSDLQRAAETALFVKSPTSQPGYFALNLKTDSDVQLTIKHVRPPGAVVRHRTDRNLTAGDTRIPWDLLDDAQKRVGPDEYTATLLATPKLTGMSPMWYGSSLRVV